MALDEALTLALTRRPELRALEITRAQNEIDRTYFKNQTKPQVNVVGGYTLSGLAGDPLSSTTQPPVRRQRSDAALLARLNELSVLANLDPLDPPPPSTSAGVPPISSSAAGDVVEQPVRAPLPDRGRPAADGLAARATAPRAPTWHVRRL